ncbi:complement decay-accelerating factor-like [Varanus komodoensis]|uniref:complement decay-accelerating factor-like n=1 Tax=Varanus komodoensis TaxID=61221 RepID=UPI001CF76F0B|nr:complement decay-accelerating factor-like [Varanus komodoensis]
MEQERHGKNGREGNGSHAAACPLRAVTLQRCRTYAASPPSGRSRLARPARAARFPALQRPSCAFIQFCARNLYTSENWLVYLSLFLDAGVRGCRGACGPPDNPNYASLKNGELKDSYPVGATVQYTCNPGYENIPGTLPSLQCLNTSEWSNITFCQRRQCHPPSINNGRIAPTGDLRLGDKVTFACNHGFRLTGQGSLRCIVSNDEQVGWNGQPPLCKMIHCFPPPKITNGIHSGHDDTDYLYGTAVTYKCDAGFSLTGNQTISCTIAENSVDGKWSGPAPECKDIFTTGIRPRNETRNNTSGSGRTIGIAMGK